MSDYGYRLSRNTMTGRYRVVRGLVSWDFRTRWGAERFIRQRESAAAVRGSWEWLR